MMRKVIFFCYAFVIGTALPTVLAPTYPAWSVRFGGLNLVRWFLLASILSGLCAWILNRGKNQTSAGAESLPASLSPKDFLISFLEWTLLALCAIALSAFNYYRAVDISSPQHILNFLDTTISDRTLVRGTIVRDPDDRGNYAYIDIRPEEIVKFSENTLVVDAKQPHIEFRTKVEKVIDGDTIQIFETPPSWEFPDMDAGRSVRLLGINAPEIPHPARIPQEYGIEAEPGGWEAKDFLKKMVEGKSIILKIAKAEPQDRYGRWLALIYLPGSKESVNEKILKKNLAKVAFVSTEGLVHLKPETPVSVSGSKPIAFGKIFVFQNPFAARNGFVRAKIVPSIGEELYSALAYGQKIEVDSALLEPRRQTNPSGFDFAKYLRARNVFAMTLPIKKPENIRILGEGEMDPLIALSLNLKKKMTAVLRETMPYPQSAFLGGVTLGLRGGVPDKVKEEFQATGVIHVLSVSGLHVGFVSALLIMATRLFNLSKAVTFLFIAFSLIVFAIITGASPATVRSVLMFSIGQFFYSFFGMGLRGSTVMTIPVSAFILLFFSDPLLLTDGSFALSYVAIWSLAHLSDPVERFFRYNVFTRGFIFFPYFFVLAGLTAVSLYSICGQIEFLRNNFEFFQKIPLMNDWLPHYIGMMIGMYLMGLVIYLGFRWWKSVDLVEWGYRGGGVLVRGMLIFTCAQVAILIGFMWPLSSVFFQRFPISGSFANFLAIPISGFITQYGLIASSLVTSTRLLINDGPVNFFLALFGMSYTPVGFAVLTSGLVTFFYGGIIGLKVYLTRCDWIDDWLYDPREDLQKFLPSFIFLLGFLALALLEKQSQMATQVALSIQGFNWVLCDVFLGMCKNWAEYVPYPFIDQMTAGQVGFYYALVLIFAFFRPLKTVCAKIWKLLPKIQIPTPAKKWVAATLLILILAGGILVAVRQTSRPKLLVTFFDCGQGNAILIRTPQNKGILIDGGWGAIDTGEIPDEFFTASSGDVSTKKKPGPQTSSGWDFGESAIATTLSKYRIASIDLIVNTIPRAGNLSAIPFVANNFPVKELVIPYSPKAILSAEQKMIEYEKFLNVSGLSDVLYRGFDGEEETLKEPDRFEPYLRFSTSVYAEFLRKKDLKVGTARAGKILYEESADGKKLTLRVIYPKGEVRPGTRTYRRGDDPLGSRNLVLKLEYGDFSCLIPTQVSLKAIESLMKRDKSELESDVLLLTKNGHPFWNRKEFLEFVNPKTAVIQYGYLPRDQSRLASVRMKDWYLLTTEKRLKSKKISSYRTDRLGAVFIESDGREFDERRDMKWVLKDKQAQDSSAEDSSEKLNIGL